MSQVSKPKSKKIKDNETGTDKITKKLRLSFRGKSKKSKEKDKNRSDDEGDKDHIADHIIINNVGYDQDKIIVSRKNDENLRISEVSASEGAEEVANAIVDNILATVFTKCDSAMLRNGTVITINPPAEVRLRNPHEVKSDDKVRKLSNRRASVLDLLDPNSYKRDSIRRDSLYSVEEYDEELDENENKLHHKHAEAVNLNVGEQPKKKGFLNKLFRKKPDVKKHDKSLLLGRKYSSTLELSPSHQTFERSPSFIKRKLTQLVSNDSPGILKRSFSVRDVDKKKDKPISKEKLTEMKNLEWQKSLQNLRDTDNYVSYDDMSFINYDTLDTLSYTETRNPVNLHRTQSLIVHGSPNSFRPGVARGASVPPHYHSTNDISDQSEALSLPALHQAIQEHEEIVFETPQPPPRFLRRPQSICSEDGRQRQTRDNGSFRSAGSGCAKLKRTNAYRQKSRDVHTSFHDGSRNGSVRIRSRNNRTYLVRCCALRSNSKAHLRVASSGDSGRQTASCRINNSTLFDIVKLFATKNLKIAREHLSIEQQDQRDTSADTRPHEWRKLVGSIRRRVQRHASSSSTSNQEASTSLLPTTTTPAQPISRKNSLTQSRFDFFKKSKDDSNKSAEKNGKVKPLTRQKSVEHHSSSPKVQDYFKGLTSKDKSKSVSVKNIHMLASSPTMAATGSNSLSVKGVRKGDKNSSNSGNKTVKIGSGHKKLSKKEIAKEKNRDDFLKATMRIFLVVSPPVGKIQVRSRSLNHLDTLEMRYGAPSSPDAALKDSRSEPDCTKPLLAPPDPNAEPPPSPTVEVPSSKRHVLSRSQKSSSECFSVNFEVGDESTWDNELFFPATRGVTLHESLLKLCELRAIDLHSCDAWLQDKESNTNTLLNFSQDTANLVGRHIRITAKDFGISKRSSLNQSKKSIGSTRQKSSGIFSSSTEDPAYPNWPHDARLSFQDADTSKKQSKQRWSGLFGNNKDTKMEALAEHLNNYTKHGVPTPNIYPQGQCDSLDALYKLENDWREIIDYKDLTERQQQQQTAVWELIKTEVAYIKTLKVVTELFLACLKNLQSVNILKEIDTEKLFSNITEILDTNVQFWRNNLFPLVKNMRQYKQPPCIETMAHGFLNMKDTFRAYFQYCAEQARCQHYCRENHAHNDLFTAYLAWCETQKECNRLRLMDILVQPMQRLTKYGLLLKAILKNTDEEVERDTLNLMIRSVDDFVNKVNSSLRQRQDTERLRGLIIRIESYDVVESKDDDLERLLKSYSTLDLTKPMINCSPDRKRHLLLEGDLKLKDSSTSKMEVHCFLLTDMLLVCKPSTKKGGATMRVIRQPYLVDRLVVHELNRETPCLALIYKNEFDMAVAGFVLQNNDPKKLKSWKDGIAKAQILYSQAKQQTYLDEEGRSFEADYSFGDVLESDYHSLQLAPRSPLASSSRASRVSSLAHSHSGSVEMNDQSSIGSGKDHSRAVSVENENRTASISSDEGVQPLPPDKSPVSQKNSFKQRLLNKSPNTLTVQPYTNLGQSLPNLSLGSANISGLSLNLNQNTLSVPNAKNGSHLLSPTHRGISYPPPSPTRGNLRRGLAISQNKNPPLLKTRHVNSTASVSSGQVPTSFDFDVPVIAGVLPGEQYENFSRSQLRQGIVKRNHRNDNKRYYTAGTVDDIKKNDNRDASIHKRLSWNYSSQEPPPTQEDET